MTTSLKRLDVSARLLAAIGLAALTTTQEINGLWLATAWSLFMAGLFTDRLPGLQRAIRRAETSAAIALVVATLIDFFVVKNTIFVVVAHFLMLFQMFKVIGPRERKDGVQMGLIGFFQLLAACTLSADIWQAALLVLLMPVGTAYLYWNYAARIAEESGASAAWPDQSLRRMHRTIQAIALPLNVLMTVAVFVFFPRLTFNLRVPGFGAGRSGYTDQLNLAQNGTVGQDAAVAAWMGFSDDAQRNRWSGYLRGDVLDTFDGQEWSTSRTLGSRLLTPDLNKVFHLRPLRGSTPFMHVQLTVLNTAKHTLFTPGTPLEITAPFARMDMNDAGALHWNAALQRPMEATILAIGGERQEESGLRTEDTRYLQLPDQGLDRTRALASDLAAGKTPAQIADALTAYLRTHYRYSLDLGETIPANPVDAFLFERRQGFCIHFASALAIMLRLNGIPSRVVAGYYQGEWNPLAHQILFREKNAHAWVEAYVDGHWQTYDPSPRAEFDAASLRGARIWWLRARETWDYLDYQWNRLIIEYDVYAQLRALARLHPTNDRGNRRWDGSWNRWNPRLRGNAAQESADSADVAIGKRVKLLAIGGGLFLLILLIGRTRQHRTRSDIPAFYVRFLRRMNRAGVAKQRSETAAEFAQRAVRQLPKHASLIEQTTTAYYQVRFRKK